MTLTGFLTARLDEDEAAARTCPPWPWRVATAADEGDDAWSDQTVVAADGIPVTDPYALSGPQTRAVRDHIARHDPARVLAEVEAKRRIVEVYEDERQRMDIYNRDHERGLLTTEGDLRARHSANARWAGLDVAVRLLAMPYADHPGFDPDWRL